MTEKDAERIYRQIASLAAVPITQGEIAKLLDATEESILKIMELEDYKEIERQIKLEQVEQNSTFNNEWDALEKRSLQIIKDNLQYNRDGEFALRVAAITNRAKRRSVNNDANTIPAQAGMRAVISLPMQFITNIQNNGGIVNTQARQASAEATLKQKVNCLLPAGVEKLFSNKEPVKELDMLADVDIE